MGRSWNDVLEQNATVVSLRIYKHIYGKWKLSSRMAERWKEE